MQRPGRGCCLLTSFHGLLSLLSFRTQDLQPRDGTSHHALSHQSLIRKILYRLACSPILWRHFLSGGSLLSGDFGLCPGDIKPPLFRLKISFYFKVCLYISVSGLVYLNGSSHRIQKENIGDRGAGATGCCELPDIVLGL